MKDIKGVGVVTVTTLLALLPELRQLDRREIAALVGRKYSPCPALLSNDAA